MHGASLQSQWTCVTITGDEVAGGEPFIKGKGRHGPITFAKPLDQLHSRRGVTIVLKWQSLRGTSQIVCEVVVGWRTDFVSPSHEARSVKRTCGDIRLAQGQCVGNVPD